MKIDKLDRVVCKNIRQELLPFLEKAGKKIGVKITTGNGSFTEDAFTLKVVFNVIRDGKVVLPEESNFRKYASMFGMKPEDLGQEFISHGHTFKIVGLKPDRPKYPVIGERLSDGRKYKFEADRIVQMLKGNK